MDINIKKIKENIASCVLSTLLAEKQPRSLRYIIKKVAMKSAPPEAAPRGLRDRVKEALNFGLFFGVFQKIRYSYVFAGHGYDAAPAFKPELCVEETDDEDDEENRIDLVDLIRNHKVRPLPKRFQVTRHCAEDSDDEATEEQMVDLADLIRNGAKGRGYRILPKRFQVTRRCTERLRPLAFNPEMIAEDSDNEGTEEHMVDLADLIRNHKVRPLPKRFQVTHRCTERLRPLAFNPEMIADDSDNEGTEEHMVDLANLVKYKSKSAEAHCLQNLGKLRQPSLHAVRRKPIIRRCKTNRAGPPPSSW